MATRSLLLLLLIFLPTTAVSAEPPITLACLLMVRDEAFNIRQNIPLWYSKDPSFFDAFVVAVDERTTDDTVLALEQTIPAHVPRHIFHYSFDGFGNSRTEVFEHAWAKFSKISHVMVADPDWKPNMDLISKSDLTHSIETYQFKIWDRSGLTTRNTNWLMKHTPGLYFEYYVHELLRFAHGGPYLDRQKNLKWEVSEVESGNSWHQTVGHGEAGNRGASRTYKRFEFDLSLLEREQKDLRYTDSQHTLYYLGAIYCAMVEGSPDYSVPFLTGLPLTPTQQEHAEKCVYYHTKRIELHKDSINTELTYASHRWLPYSYFYMLLDFESAVPHYKNCIAFDPERVDCPMELSKLYTWTARHEEAYNLSLETILMPYADRSFANSFYTYVCMVPLQASRAAVNHIITYGWNSGVYALGHHLMRKAASACTSGFPLEDPNVMIHLESFYEKATTLSGGGKGDAIDETFRCTVEDNSRESDALRFTGGQHYFCLDEESPVGTELTGECSKFRENFRILGENMNDMSSFGPSSFQEMNYYLKLPSDPKIAYLASKSTYESSVKSACVTSFSVNPSPVVVLLGGAGYDLIEAEARKMAKECGSCSGTVEVLNVGEEWNFNGADGYDYVDLGSGLLNLDVVVNPETLVKGVVNELLNKGGFVGALTHEYGESVMERIETLKSLVERNDLGENIALELAEVLGKSALGYSSRAVAVQLFNVARGNVDLDIFNSAGLNVIVGGARTEGSHMEFYATRGDKSPSTAPRKLSKESVLISRNSKFLNNARTKMMTQNKELIGHEALFPEIILEIIHGKNRRSLGEIYAVCNEEGNRRGNYLDSNVLTMESFLETAQQFIDAMGGMVVAA
ncbi:hypothetical protein TrVE_jg91 [Triparma verrucosa]|uniref:Uncharacterized protein n=1 Tax=Triparma verrucosa TaxID=1606542 RepID=A0A9W7FDM0_9STRA|nr:hypothetical protein TrVE_jg91 [Triparma verrucosa]